MKLPTLGLLVGVAMTGASAIGATLVASTTYNGHSYELWDELDISWAGANLAASMGGGYLAVLTDEAETVAVYSSLIGNGFFTANDGQQYQAWIGGYTTAGGFSTTDATAWAWVTGEAWNIFATENFAPLEPNGDSSGLSINRFGTSEWNDESGRVGGFIVEKDVPDAGSSLVLLGASFALLAAYRRVRSR